MEIDVGQTDSNGNLLVVAVAATSDTPGNLQVSDGDGKTDTSGSLICKAY